MKKHLLVTLIVIAAIFVVGGIGKFHANPFKLALTTHNPTVLVKSESGVSRAIADQSGSVLLLMNDKGKLRRTVKINNADHPHERISILHAEGDSIYANVVTTDNMHLVREQIRLYNKRGK